MNIAIIGGGFAGLGAAYELAAAGHRIDIYEKGTRLGGLGAAISVAGTDLECYYHHMFPTYTDMLSVAREIGIGNKVFFIKAKMGVAYRGNIFSFDSAFDLLRFSPLPYIDRVRTGVVLLFLKLVKNPKRFRNASAMRWTKKYFGKHAFRVLWEPLLTSKFGTYAPSISMVWLWGRIYERPTTFGYFHGGFQTFVSALTSYLHRHGANIYTNTAVTAIHKKDDGQFDVVVADKKKAYDHVIVTTPPGVLKKIGYALFDTSFHQYLSTLQYVGTICVVLILRQKLDSFYWTNVNDSDSPFVAVIQQTNLVDASVYGGKHPVYLGRYIDPREALYQQEDKDILDLFINRLTVMYPRFDTSWIETSYVFRAPETQPVAPVGYDKTRPGFTTPVDGLWWASMSQVYPWDRGTNHSFAVGRDCAREILEKDTIQ